MKTTDFMLQLAQRLIKERSIAESTATQYLQTLYKLSGNTAFTNMAWARKFEDVQKRIDEYAPSTQGNQYMVLTSALSLFSDKPTYKAVHAHWRDKMMESRKAKKEEPIHEKSEKQDENWLNWNEIETKKEGLREDIMTFAENKNISLSQYDKLLQYVVLSLYTDIQPRRNQDFLEMYVIKKYGKDHDAAKNYYDLHNHKFIFNKYKTAKTNNQQMIDVPESLQKTLALFLKHHPLAKQKAKEFKLLVKADGSNLNSVNAITRILNRIFGKKVGSSMLRHAYLSSKYGEVSKDMEEDAEAMGHSTAVQKEYIKY